MRRAFEIADFSRSLGTTIVAAGKRIEKHTTRNVSVEIPKSTLKVFGDLRLIFDQLDRELVNKRNNSEYNLPPPIEDKILDILRCCEQGITTLTSVCCDEQNPPSSAEPQKILRQLSGAFRRIRIALDILTL
jgi:hypothetical protein